MLLFQQVFVAKSSKSIYVFEIYTDEFNKIHYHSYKTYDNGALSYGSTYQNVEEMKEELQDFYSRPDDFDKKFPFEYDFEGIVIMEESAKRKQVNNDE